MENQQKYQKLTDYDMAWCLRRAPKKLLNIMQQAPSPELFIAGGYIRSVISGEPVNDIDLFCPTKKKAEHYAELLAGGLDREKFETDNAITLPGTPAIQFITRWVFPGFTELLSSFDFTIACAAIWWQGGFEGEWRSACHEDYYRDLAARRLAYLKPTREEEPGGSMLRVLKFYQRGYRIPLSDLGSVISRLVEGVEDLAAHDETFRAKLITGLLYEVDPAATADDPAYFEMMKAEEK